MTYIQYACVGFGRAREAFASMGTFGMGARFFQDWSLGKDKQLADLTKNHDVVVLSSGKIEPGLFENSGIELSGRGILIDKQTFVTSVPGGEAFGAYQVEALAAGVPVVQPRAGCYPEFVETTKGGIIYDPNNSQILSAAIATLLSAPEQIRQMGTQGRKTILERFSMDNMARDMVGVYEEVLRK
ncbi:glycosyltransferase [Acidobacteriota bacterium]